MMKPIRFQFIQVCLDSYSANSGGCVRTAVRATLTQLLTALTDRLDIPLVSDLASFFIS